MNSHSATNYTHDLDVSSESRQRWVLWLIAVQLGVLFAPTMIWLWERWTMSVWHNGHGILIFLVVVYLVRGELKRRSGLPLSSSPWGFVILIPAMFIHMLDAGIHSQLLSAIAIILSFPGFFLIFLGIERTKYILFPLFTLFLTLPIPLVATESIHLALRHITADSVAWLLPVLGVPVFARGTTLEIPNGSLQVADACSGFSTLYAAITVAILTAYFSPVIHRRTLVLLVAVPLAIGVNIVRVMLLTLSVYWFSVDILKTSWHTISGLMTYIVALPIICWLGQAPDSKIRQ